MTQKKRSHLVTDQIGRTFMMDLPIERVVSLVPSITELLFDLGVGDKVVGRTKFCVHPKDRIMDVAIMGGTKMTHHDRIHQVKPDLIIANKEENNKEDIEDLEDDFPIWVSDVGTLKEAFDMIHELGALFDKGHRAKKIINNTEEILNDDTLDVKSAIYLIWRDPFMTIGGNTYIHSIMTQSGYKNLFGDQSRYPQLTIEDLVRLKPEVILLSSEPYPFKEKHVNELQEALPDTEVKLVNGEYFSWYGSRILKCSPNL